MERRPRFLFYATLTEGCGVRRLLGEMKEGIILRAAEHIYDIYTDIDRLVTYLCRLPGLRVVDCGHEDRCHCSNEHVDDGAGQDHGRQLPRGTKKTDIVVVVDVR